MKDDCILLMAISQRSELHPDIYIAEWFLDSGGNNDLQFYQYPDMAAFLAEVTDWNMQGVKIVAMVYTNETLSSEYAEFLNIYSVPVLNAELGGFFKIARMPQAFSRITGHRYEIDQRNRDLAATIIIHNYESAIKLYEQAKKIRQ